jgi:hypothetical protein
MLFQPLISGRPGSHFRPVYPNLPTIPSPAMTLAALKAVHATAALVVPTFLEVSHPARIRMRA